MLKNNYFKYILIIITFSLIFFLSSCSDNKKKYELYTSLMDELKDVNDKIDESEFYSTYYTFEIYEWTYINNAPYKYSFPDKDSYEKIDCVMNKDLSYLYQNRYYYVQDERKNSSNYYSIHNNDIYKVQKLDKTYSEEVEYEFNPIEDGTALDDIIGFTEFEKLRINGFDGKNGKINKKENSYNGSLAYDYTIEMKYSDFKNEELINYLLRNDIKIKEYIKEDSKITLNFNIRNNDYKFLISIEFVKEDTLYTAEIEFSKYEKNDNKKDEIYHQNIDLIFNEEKNINLLAKGEEVLYFTPKYSGYYDININLSNPVNVTIGEEKYSGSNLKITILLNSNEKYPINIENQDKYSEGSIKIIYSDKVNMDNISIRGNDEFVIKLNKEEGFRNIITNNDDILIEDLFYDYKYFYHQSDSFKPTSKCSYYFKEKEYFILLKNNSNNDIDNISISINDVDEIKIGCVNELNLFENDTYFKINNEVGGQYKVKFYKNDEETNISFGLMSKEYYSLPISYYSVISMDGGKTYYLSLWKYSDALFKVDIQKEEDEYQWEITGGKYSSYRTFEEEIELEAGYTYNIKFIKNGKVENVKFYGKFGFSNHEYKTRLEISETGELIIPYEILDEMHNFIRIYPKYNNRTELSSFTICPI